MRGYGNIVGIFIAAIVLTVVALPASAQSKSNQKSVEIPVCSKSFGTLAVVDHKEGGQWWLEMNLSPPSVLINDFVRRSGCFNLVDRSTAFTVSEMERELFASGMLRPGSNVGLGQIIAADYIMVAALVGQNINRNEIRLDDLPFELPRIPFLGRPRMPNIDTSKKTADVVLLVADTRSSAIVVTMEGHGKNTDVNFRVSGNSGADGVGVYAKTDMGRVITRAYLDAYIKMIDQFRRLPESPSANNNLQAVEVTREARLLANPQGTGQAIRSLDVGMLLYPTGNREGAMWEVDDELGYRGWVSVESFRLAGRGNTGISVGFESVGSEDNFENWNDFEDDSEEWEELR